MGQCSWFEMLCSSAIMSAAKPSIAIIGPGALGSALALALHKAGYPVAAIMARPSSMARAHKLARRIGSRAVALEAPGTLRRAARNEMSATDTGATDSAAPDAGIFWICVPDDAIAGCASALASTMRSGWKWKKADWKRRTVLHSSGALGSSELSTLRRLGASVGSVHPMMTFASSGAHSFSGVPFALEGDRRAVGQARAIARALGGEVLALRPRDKALYHLWGFMSSPLLLTLLFTAEGVGAVAGIPRRRGRSLLAPMLRQTVENYERHGAAASLTGPLVRGDVETIRKHIRALRRVPQALEVYPALARAATRSLPVKNRREIQLLLRNGERS
jgi:predicted short-subunit dehydrogenase-like oxidoreductase (DUF2520 family)